MTGKSIINSNMKIINKIGLTPMCSVALIAVLLLSSVVCFGQAKVKGTSDILAPSQEEFVEVDAVAAPWRESGCNLIREVKEPGCDPIAADAWRASDFVSLYDEEGMPWYTLNLNVDFRTAKVKQQNRDFAPLTTSYGLALLRMVGESEHWYKVEVNEKTREIKYALKGQPQWEKTSWNHWLYRSGVLFLRDQKILDKPNGRPVSDLEASQIDKVTVVKVDGDWVLIHEFARRNGFQGWVHWRDGRKILVDSELIYSASYRDARDNAEN